MASDDSDRQTVEPLSERELEVLSLLARRKTNHEIAVELILSVNTVKWYARQVYAKLGVSDRYAAAQRALELGLVRTEPKEAQAPHNLPAHLTPFVGRARELAKLEVLLSNPSTRLITVLGPGGMGKTRLALQAALGRWKDHAQAVVDGVYVVSLAEVDNVQDVAEIVAQAVGMALTKGQENVSQQLERFLRKKQMLLVLDNAEHLVGEEFSMLLDGLLGAAAGLTVVATSRRRLGVHGEQLMWLEGLQLPAAGAMAAEPHLNVLKEESSALAFFLLTARRVQADFGLSQANFLTVIEICRLLEGMPLGIELAAGWMGLLSPAELLEELARDPDILSTQAGNLDAEKRSLRAVFNTSLALLEDGERQALRCLSIFRGGFRREAARVVCDATLPVLQALVNKCWLTRDASGRFWMHNLLRQYAAEALDLEPEQANETKLRHCIYFCDWLAARQEAVVGRQQQATLAAVECELSNVRSAFLAAVQMDKLEALGEAVHALGRFYRWQGRYVAGESFFNTVLKTIDSSGHALQVTQVTRLRLLVWQATFQSLLCHYRRSEAMALEAEMLADRLQQSGRPMLFERLQIAKDRGYIRHLGGNHPQRALYYFYEAHKLAQLIDSPEEKGLTLLGLARARRSLSLEEAEREVVRAIATLQESGNEVALADAVVLHGNLLLLSGRHHEAAALLRSDTRLMASHADVDAYRLVNLGWAHFLLGEFDEAERCVVAGINKYREKEIEFGMIWTGLLSSIRLHQGRYDAAVHSAEERAKSAPVLNRTEGEAIEACIRAACALAFGRWEETAAHSRRSLMMQQPSPQWHVVFAGSCLALSLRKLGDSGDAAEFLASELQLALTARTYPQLILALLAGALLLVDRGNTERAVAIYARVWQEPFAHKSVWLREVAGRELQETAELLGSKSPVIAEPGESAPDLWQMAELLLQELDDDVCL